MARVESSAGRPDVPRDAPKLRPPVLHTFPPHSTDALAQRRLAVARHAFPRAAPCDSPPDGGSCAIPRVSGVVYRGLRAWHAHDQRHVAPHPHTTSMPLTRAFRSLLQPEAPLLMEEHQEHHRERRGRDRAVVVQLSADRGSGRGEQTGGKGGGREGGREKPSLVALKSCAGCLRDRWCRCSRSLAAACLLCDVV